MSNHTESPKIAQQRFQRCLTPVKGLKLALTLMVAGLVFAAPSLQAANILSNPGFEASSGFGYFGSGSTSFAGNWTWGQPGYGGFWLEAGTGVDNGANNQHSGNNFFKYWGQYSGNPNTNSVYQDNACGAGATYTCDFWFGSTASAFTANPSRFAWGEVAFYDGSSSLIALYKSDLYNTNYTGTLTTNFSWNHFFVTNVCDITSGAVTGTTSVLTAPAGAASVRFRMSLTQSVYDGGDFSLDDVTLNQTGGPVAPVIAQVYPGNMLFASNHISFHVTSATSTPINNSDIHLIVDGVDVSGGCSFSGSSPDITVTYAGVSDNSWGHTATITAKDTLNLTAPPQSMAFDTIHPAFVWEAEDYDFTNSIAGGGGDYYNNPVPSSTLQANSYFGMTGVSNIDYFKGGTTVTAYRPDRVRVYGSGDLARQTFITAQITDPLAKDWEIDNIDTGNWQNYTRNYPAGTYNVYARVSGNSGALTKLNLDSVAGGVTNSVGVFSFTGQGWGTWQYVPLIDNNENLLPITFGGVQTLRATLSPVGGLNEGFYFLVPAVVGQPFFSSISPSNGQMFATGNTFSFTVSSPSVINASGISINLNGLDVTANPNTTISGGTTATASCALLQSNVRYTVVINVTNSVGATASRTIKFDTMNPANFYVKLEDWDYNNGLYDTTGNGLTPGAYAGFGAVTNVDYALGSAVDSPYRGPDGLHQENCSDALLPGYSTGANYDIGSFNSGQWANYTRNYPAGNYQVFARLASGGSGTVTLSQVTGGQGTTTQTLKTLGTATAASGGWQTWSWYLVALNGTPTVVNLGGVNTIRVTSGGGLNANYFMFVPVSGITISATTSGGNAVISFPTTAGLSYRVLYNSSLTSGSWSALPAVTGDGTVKSVTDPATASQRFYKVVSP